MYRFRPITAVRYIGGTPYIYFQEKDAGREDFTSQLYLPEHPENEGDFLYMRLGSGEVALRPVSSKYRIRN
tara:strand:- start:51 stop:263 length:213 start_codon:yes stop_codon:yes gene_type:complete